MKITLTARVPYGIQSEEWYRNNLEAKVKHFQYLNPIDKTIEIEVELPDSMVKHVDEVVVGHVKPPVSRQDVVFHTTGTP